MSDLPSLSFPSPTGWGRDRTRSSSRGRGGQGRGRYSALELNDMDLDEIPLMNEERGVASDEEREEEKDDVEGTVWHQLGGRRRWQQRMRSHSTLVGLIFGGGWKVVLKK